MPEDKRYELIEGKLFMVPSPNEHHQRISRELEYSLLSYVKKNKSGFVYSADAILYSPLLKELEIDLNLVF